MFAPPIGAARPDVQSKTAYRDRLVVVEVKTRSGTRFGEPAEAVTARKIARIRRLAQAWLTAHHVRWCGVRFDVVAVLMEPDRPATLQHYEAAF